MGTTCRSCGQVLVAGITCCAELAETWKCRRCQRLSRGFVAPFARCSLCGGVLDSVEPHRLEDPLAVHPIREAVQLELDSYHFYRLAWRRVGDPVLRSFLEEFAQLEMDHLHELVAKYHIHLDPKVLAVSPAADRAFARSLFAGIDLEDPASGPAGLFDRAIEMEHRTLHHFRSLAEIVPEGPEKDVCLELAAEELEHIRLLTAEREHIGAH
jgi:rubrerythrin